MEFSPSWGREGPLTASPSPRTHPPVHLPGTESSTGTARSPHLKTGSGLTTMRSASMVAPSTPKADLQKKFRGVTSYKHFFKAAIVVRADPPPTTECLRRRSLTDDKRGRGRGSPTHSTTARTRR